jgi:hypothetical protein
MAPLYFSQDLVPDKIPAKCELRDVIHSFAVNESSLLFSSNYAF